MLMGASRKWSPVIFGDSTLEITDLDVCESMNAGEPMISQHCLQSGIKESPGQGGVLGVISDEAICISWADMQVEVQNIWRIKVKFQLLVSIPECQLLCSVFVQFIASLFQYHVFTSLFIFYFGSDLSYNFPYLCNGSRFDGILHSPVCLDTYGFLKEPSIEEHARL